MMLSRIFPFSIRIVKGHSMQPPIPDGSRVVVFRWAYAFSQPKVGDVVVFRGNDDETYVKRITAAAAKGEFVVEGDNRGDSLKTPKITKGQIIGKVVARY